MASMFEQPGVGLAMQVVSFHLFRLLCIRGLLSKADEQIIFDHAIASLEDPSHDAEQVRAARKFLEVMQRAASDGNPPPGTSRKTS